VAAKRRTSGESATSLKRTFTILAAMAVASAAALAVIFWVPGAPYAVLGASVACIAAFAARRCPPSSRCRFLLVQVAALALVLAALETYVWVRSRDPDVRLEETRSAPAPSHPDLGYIFPANGSVTYRCYHRNELVFDATTRFDEHGFVRSYPSKSRTCAMVFGGSFTAGLGVDYTEAMPYRLGALAGNSLRVYNFGLAGYGPHQMLSALQNHIVADVVDCDDVKWMFYQAIPDHLRRAAGRAWWDRDGPRYVLDASGRAVRRGNFSDDFVLEGIRQLLNRSLVFRRLIGWDRRPSQRDVDLFMGILRATRQAITEQYPAAKFQVVFWDYRNELTEKLLAAMKADGFVVHRVSEILDGFPEDRKPYVLAYNRHPNARAHDLIARYLFEHVIEAGDPSPADGPAH
jgi:hypothetical protein